MPWAARGMRPRTVEDPSGPLRHLIFSLVVGLLLEATIQFSHTSRAENDIFMGGQYGEYKGHLEFCHSTMLQHTDLSRIP